MAADAGELGVSRSSANNWKNRYRATRTDGTVVTFEALTPAPHEDEQRQIRFLDQVL